jgi:hypothetical protein
MMETHRSSSVLYPDDRLMLTANATPAPSLVPSSVRAALGDPN